MAKYTQEEINNYEAILAEPVRDWLPAEIASGLPEELATYVDYRDGPSLDLNKDETTFLDECPAFARELGVIDLWQWHKVQELIPLNEYDRKVAMEVMECRHSNQLEGISNEAGYYYTKDYLDRERDIIINVLTVWDKN